MQLEKIESHLKQLSDHLDYIAWDLEKDFSGQKDLINAVDETFNAVVNFLETASREVSNKEKKKDDPFFAEENLEDREPLEALVTQEDLEEFRRQIQRLNEEFGSFLDKYGATAEARFGANMDKVMEIVNILIGEFE